MRFPNVFNSWRAFRHATKGVSYMRVADYDIAIGEFNSAVELSPRNKMYLFARGTAYFQSRSLSKALADCNTLLEKSFFFKGAYLLRSDVYCRQAKIASALDDLTTFAGLKPYRIPIFARLEKIPLLTRFAWFHNLEQDYVRAIAESTEAIELVGRDNIKMAGLLNYRSEFRRNGGDLSGALADANEALKTAQKIRYPMLHDLVIALVLNQRSATYTSLNKFDEALADCATGMYLANSLPYPHNDKALLADLHLNRAQIRRGKGDLDGALADSIESIQLKPYHAGAYEEREKIRRAMGDTEGADADHAQAVQIGADNVDYQPYSMGFGRPTRDRPLVRLPSPISLIAIALISMICGILAIPFWMALFIIVLMTLLALWLPYRIKR